MIEALVTFAVAQAAMQAQMQQALHRRPMGPGDALAVSADSPPQALPTHSCAGCGSPPDGAWRCTYCLRPRLA